MLAKNVILSNYYDDVAFALTIFSNIIVIGQCKLRKELQGYFSLASPVCDHSSPASNINCDIYVLLFTQFYFGFIGPVTIL